jgi:hypothetical protein
LSINALANAAMARRSDFAPRDRTPNSWMEISSALGATPAPVPGALPAAPAAPAVGPAAPAAPGAGPVTPVAPAVGPPGAVQPLQQAGAALSVIIGYMPTEVVTLYVPVIGALGADQSATAQTPSKPTTSATVSSLPSSVPKPRPPTTAEAAVFWTFLCLTPVVVWLVYAGKLRNAGKPLPLNPRSWPIWEAFAATSSFFVWALTLSPHPLDSHITSRVAAVLVLALSTLLGLMSPIFQRQMS